MHVKLGTMDIAVNYLNGRRLPQFAVNVNLNLSNTKNIYPPDRSHSLPAVGYFNLTKSRMNN